MAAKNVDERHMIPYVHDWAKKNGDWRGDLEGATQVDAYIVNMNSGFNIVCEAKLISDISYDVRYDMGRNQIARNIDVMLEYNEHYEKHGEELARRDKDKSIFLLVTPEFFVINSHSRLYSYKMDEYKQLPLALADDLIHRDDLIESDWNNIVSRIGWITWEDIQSTI